MMRIFKDSRFWIGVVAGTFVGPIVVSKVTGSRKANIKASE